MKRARVAEQRLVDGSGYRKFKQVIQAQGGNPQALDKFELLPNATGHARDHLAARRLRQRSSTPKTSARASTMIGAGRDTQGRRHRSGRRRHPGSQDRREGGGRLACSAASTTPRKTASRRPRELVEDAFRISGQQPEERELILEVVGLEWGGSPGLLGLVAILASHGSSPRTSGPSRPRILLWGLGLQFAFAFLVLKTDFGKLFQAAGVGVNAMLEYAEAGSQFVFGPLGSKGGPFGVVFAFQVLPIVIFIASFFSILYYFGVMQVVVKGMAMVMQKRHGRQRRRIAQRRRQHLHGPDRSAPHHPAVPRRHDRNRELFTVMTSGMAHVSGAVMAAYVKIAGVEIKHLLTAVIMTAPATIMLAKMFIPEDGQARHRGQGGSRRWRSPPST